MEIRLFQASASQGLVEGNRVRDFRQEVGYLVDLGGKQALLGGQDLQIGGRTVFH